MPSSPAPRPGSGSPSRIRTKSLKLVPHAPEHLRALIQGPDCYQQSFGLPAANGLREFFVSAEVSPDFLKRLEASTSHDPWTYGFALVHVASGKVIGMGGFKAPPGADGMVEIAYGVVPDYQGRGCATEAARALVAYAFASGRVRIVRAHPSRAECLDAGAGQMRFQPGRRSH